jgi:uncharacterized protein YwgA
MNSDFQKSFEEYISRMNQMLKALEDEAGYLRLINEKLNRISDDWQAIKENLSDYLDNDIQYDFNSEDLDSHMKSQYTASEKELEDLILCIVKEVNNHHIECVCLN